MESTIRYGITTDEIRSTPDLCSKFGGGCLFCSHYCPGFTNTANDKVNIDRIYYCKGKMPIYQCVAFGEPFPHSSN